MRQRERTSSVWFPAPNLRLLPARPSGSSNAFASSAERDGRAARSLAGGSPCLFPAKQFLLSPSPQSNTTFRRRAVKMSLVGALGDASPLDRPSNHLKMGETRNTQLCSLIILPNSSEEPHSWHRGFPGLAPFKDWLAVQTYRLLLHLFELSSKHGRNNWIPLPLLACAAWVIYVNIKLK